MEITIRKRKFRIDFVSNYCHRLYDELFHAAFKLSEAGCSVNEILTDPAKIADAEREGFFGDITESMASLRKKVIDLRFILVRELCVSNKIRFVLDFWDKETGPDDMDTFILAAISKDTKPDSKRRTSSKSGKMNVQRLVAALSKYWRPLSMREYLHEMDIGMTEQAIRYAGLPEEVRDDIFETERKPGIKWETKR